MTHTIVFPNLVEVTKQLLQYLDNDNELDLRAFAYPRLIRHLGGIDQAAETLVSLINPDIIGLQGKIITTSQ